MGPQAAPNPARWRAPDARTGAVFVALFKAFAIAVVLAGGFRAVSDDDFSRVVIAEAWAHAPRLDPSGTSWLPAPFWITGLALRVLGGALPVARAAAAAQGIGAAILVYVAARWMQEGRPLPADEAEAPREIGLRAQGALQGAALAALFPWSAYLGVATVPELPTAALAILAMASLSPAPDGAGARRRLWGAAALAIATLSRYEAWPVALVFAGVCVLDAIRGAVARALALAAAVIALAGPTAWMVWNRVAHGDTLHFLARVAAYRKALGGAEPGAAARLFTYPVALVREEPELFGLLLAALIATALRDGLPALRDRLRPYARAGAIVLAQIAALSLAMVKDGAPTHHPERALLAAMLLAALVAGALGVRLLADLRPAALAGAIGITIAALGLSAVLLRPRLVRHDFTPRADETAIGAVAASIARSGEPVLVEAASFGYFAIVAALGRPADAMIDRTLDPREGPSPSSFDDPVALRRRAAAAGARHVIGRLASPAAASLGEPRASRGGWALWPAPALPEGSR